MALPLNGMSTGSLLHLVSGSEADPTAGWTPQEKFLYQIHRDNLAAGGLGRPDLGENVTSTLYNTTVEINGRHYVLPTIWKDETGVPIDVTPDQAVERARKIGLDKFPSYDSEDAAEKRYNEMHDVMEKDLPDPAEDPSNILRQNFLRNMRGGTP